MAVLISTSVGFCTIISAKDSFALAFQKYTLGWLQSM
jgi:hypothetical protein